MAVPECHKLANEAKPTAAGIGKGLQMPIRKEYNGESAGRPVD